MQNSQRDGTFNLTQAENGQSTRSLIKNEKSATRAGPKPKRFNDTILKDLSRVELEIEYLRKQPVSGL
jgi:hypothetical protein